MQQHAARAAWLRLAHAYPAEPARIAALRDLEPDLGQLGNRLAELIAGNDAAFADILEPDALGPSRHFLNRLRHSATAALADRAQAWADQASNRHLLTPADTAYPAALHPLCDAPPMLSLIGHIDALDPPGVSMVGARHATRAGLAAARQFACELAGLGLSVVSGLAVGIDGAAHQGALDADGVTLAVSATGPDRIYPSRHRELACRIIRRGAILTEYPLGEGVHRKRFPERNRLVAALGYGVVVIEAGRRSGTLTTANHASDLGKPVMPLPGPIANPLNGGSHDLIREGASLIETTADIVALLSHAISQDLDAVTVSSPEPAPLLPPAELDPLGPLETRLLACLDTETASVDALCNTLRQPPRTVLSALSRLELAGLAERLSDGGYIRCLR